MRFFLLIIIKCDETHNRFYQKGRNYCAAYHCLKVIGNVGSDDLVLVDGASGGVGMATVELANAMGAKVIAGVSSKEKGALPTLAGASKVLIYGRDQESYKKFKDEVKSTAAELGHPKGTLSFVFTLTRLPNEMPHSCLHVNRILGCSIIVDVVHGDLFQHALLSCIEPLGKICLVGFVAGQRPIKPGLLLVKEAIVVGSLWGRWARENTLAFRNNMNDILNFMENGLIERRADNVIMIEDYAKAFELFENNAGRGNTVICFKSDASKL